MLQAMKFEREMTLPEMVGLNEIYFTLALLGFFHLQLLKATIQFVCHHIKQTRSSQMSIKLEW